MSDRLVLDVFTSCELEPMFWPPTRTDVVSAWWEHVPFANLLISEARPMTVVELGTHYGVSFAAFCEGMKKNNIPGKCYAVDTWRGDDQAGVYGEEVFESVREFIDHNYKFCGELIRSTFSDALTHFSEKSIDLLHIDGLHTYDAVKNDFENWSSKLTDQAVVLFHDTNVRQGDFGVCRFWEELRNFYPSFEFLHGHGLGVLCFGKVQSKFINALCSLNEQQTKIVRERFAQIGARWTSYDQMRRLKAHKIQVEQRASHQESLITKLEHQIFGLQDVVKMAAEANTMLEKKAIVQDQLRSKLARKILALQHDNVKIARRLKLLQEQNSKLIQDIRDSGHKSEIYVRHSVTSDLSDRVSPVTRNGSDAVDETKFNERTVNSLIGTVQNEDENLQVIASSGFFDDDFYAGNLEAFLNGINPILHYLSFGEARGMAPSGRFDPIDYAALNPDVAASGQNLLLHYLRHGRTEGRILSPHETTLAQCSEIEDAASIASSSFFDQTSYAGRFDALSAGIDPALHYLRFGESAGLVPSAYFDPVDYASLNPDVAITGQNLLLHYIRYGRSEGRAYRVQYANVDDSMNTASGL